MAKESLIEDNARKLVESLGGRWEKLPPTTGQKHRPDRLMVFPDVVPVYVELKRPGEAPTAEQTEALRLLVLAGLRAVWFNEWEWLEGYIRAVARLSKRRKRG